jgi:hypothetical protein
MSNSSIQSFTGSSDKRVMKTLHAPVLLHMADAATNEKETERERKEFLGFQEPTI